MPHKKRKSAAATADLEEQNAKKNLNLSDDIDDSIKANHGQTLSEPITGPQHNYLIQLQTKLGPNRFDEVKKSLNLFHRSIPTLTKTEAALLIRKAILAKNRQGGLRS